MKDKILISDKVNIGTLDEFLDLVAIVRNEFNMQTVAIKEINNDDRNMYAQFVSRFGVMAIDYDYYYEKIYLDVVCNDEYIEIAEQLKNRIKEIVTT